MTLDGRPIQVDPEPIGLVAKVVDAPAGVRRFVEQDTRIVKAFRNGIVQAGDTLHPLAPNKLSGRELALAARPFLLGRLTSPSS